MPKVYYGNYLAEDWNDQTKIVTSYDRTGAVTGQRNYTPEEVVEASNRLAEQSRDDAQIALERDIYNAVADIIATRDLAISDQATATSLENAARSISSQLQTQSSQIAGWTPSNTYNKNDLVVIRDQIKVLTDRQKTIADALADFYAYRRANDQAVVKIYNAVLWLAQRVSGRF